MYFKPQSQDKHFILKIYPKTVFLILLLLAFTFILFYQIKHFNSNSSLHALDVVYSPDFSAIEKQKWGIPLTANANLKNWQDATRKNILNHLDIQTLNIDNVKYRVISSEIINKKIKRSFIIFTAFDEAEIPAYIHSPVTTSPTPLILVLPGHVNDGQSGIEQTSREIESYQHAIAMQLATLGYTTLTFELRGFGYLGTPIYPNHKVVAYNAILANSSYKALIFRDISYAKNILFSQENAIKERLGITGVSFGGELSLQYAALDTDIKVIVSQSFNTKTGYKRYIDNPLSKQPHYCHLIPDVDKNIKQEEWFWLNAPRPLLITRGNDERSLPKKSFSRYQLAWELTNEATKFNYLFEKGGHEYFVEPSLEYFKQHLLFK